MRGARRGSPYTYGRNSHTPRVDLPGCEGKTVYRTAEEAHAAMLLMPRSTWPGLRPYHCPQCGCVHLGHEKRTRRGVA